jgi:outer membrane protein W
MRRLLVSLSLVALVVSVIAAPVVSAQKSLDFHVGGFAPTELAARSADDVLSQDANQLRGIGSAFQGDSIGGDWLVPILKDPSEPRDRGWLFINPASFEAGLGVGFYRRTVPTVNAGVVNANGDAIGRALGLQIVPITATLRFLPFGHDDSVKPYIGAGLGIFAWRYSETGQFADAQNNILSAKLADAGVAVGPVLIVGVRVLVGRLGYGLEIRYQRASGTLPSDQSFAGTKIDLGGFHYLFTVNMPLKTGARPAVRESPNYEELIEQCRRETTQATLQRVYRETHNVTATEAICGVRDLKVNKGKVVTFEMPLTIVKP